MKKLFSYLMMIVTILVISGCSSDPTYSVVTSNEDKEQLFNLVNEANFGFNEEFRFNIKAQATAIGGIIKPINLSGTVQGINLNADDQEIEMIINNLATNSEVIRIYAKNGNVHKTIQEYVVYSQTILNASNTTVDADLTQYVDAVTGQNNGLLGVAEIGFEDIAKMEIYENLTTNHQNIRFSFNNEEIQTLVDKFLGISFDKIDEYGVNDIKITFVVDKEKNKLTGLIASAKASIAGNQVDIKVEVSVLEGNAEIEGEK